MSSLQSQFVAAYGILALLQQLCNHVYLVLPHSITCRCGCVVNHTVPMNDQYPLKNPKMMVTASREIPHTEDHKQLSSECVYFETLIPTKNDDQLYFQIWSPVNAIESTPTMLYVHGLGDYSDRFSRFVKRFLDAGIRVAAFDHIGHGRSSGLHGFVPSMETLTDGLECVLKVMQSNPKIAITNGVYLMGMSMGGLVVVHRAVCHPDKSYIKGIVAINPLVRVHAASMPHSVVVSAARIIAKVAPTLALSPANIGQNHPDPLVEADFYNDPGTYSGWLRVGTGMSMMQGTDEIWDKINGHVSTPPILVIYGSADKVTDPGATVSFMKKLEISNNVKLMCMEGASHVIWATDEEADAVFKPIFKWVKELEKL